MVDGCFGDLGYIDLFGTKSIRKVCFVDEPISIVSHPDWSEQERRDAGAMVSSPEQVLAASNTPPPANPSPDDTRLIVRGLLRELHPISPILKPLHRPSSRMTRNIWRW